jgi:hypothetical protein
VRVGLRHVAEPRADLERLVGDVEAEHAHAAAVRLHEAEQRLEHRALPRAVRPEQADRAGAELGAHVAQRGGPAVGDGDVVEADDGVGHLPL